MQHRIAFLARRQCALCVLLVFGFPLFSACAYRSEHAHSTDVLSNQEWKESSQMEGIFNIEQGFQGLTLEGPDIVYLTEMEAGRFIWDDSSKPAETTYRGVLNISGYFSVFVPDGMQNGVWTDLSDNIEFVVKDLKSGKVQRRSQSAHAQYRMSFNRRARHRLLGSVPSMEPIF